MSVLATTRLFAQPLPLSNSLACDVDVYVREGLNASYASEAPCVCAVGAFDGVHLGHRALIDATLSDAQNQNCLSVAVTFNPDPAQILTPDKSEQELLCIEDRIRALLSLGLDAVATIHFTPEFAQLSYQEFFDTYLHDLLHCKSVHVGTNFRLGKGGLGTPDSLREYACGKGVMVYGHELTSAFGHTVSATRIRSLLRAGKTMPAASLLARPHLVRGSVEHGRGQGSAFGFPTANIHVADQVCLPAEGVYAAYVGTGEHMWPAAVNVGAPRTFGGKIGVPLIEATLVGFEGNLYNQDLICCFDQWLRGPEHFPTLEKLEKTVLANIDWVRKNLGEGEVVD